MSRLLERLSFVLIALLIGLVAAAHPSRMVRAETIIQVNSQADQVQNDGNCTLREALLAANTNTAVDACPAGASATADRIRVPAGTYTLALVGPAENLNQTGDLDITSSLVLEGSGSWATTVDANHIDRVFHVSNAGTVTLQGMTITRGDAPVENNQSQGGGILNMDTTLTLYDVLLLDNHSGNSGGGLDNFGGIVTLNRSTVKNNVSYRGGGIFNGSYLTVQDSLIEGNSSSGDGSGGGIYNFNTLYLFNSLVKGNSTNRSGGGLDNNGFATLVNSTFTGNEAGDDPSGDGLGGGIFNQANMEISFVTVVGNTGGGITHSGETRVNNTLIAGNTNQNCFGTVTSLGYNLEDADTCGFDQTGDLVGQNPNLAALANNGGPTFTFALQAGSPAIDAANPVDCQETDQRGAWRPADGDGDRVERCDIGAYEYGADFGYVFLPLTWK